MNGVLLALVAYVVLQFAVGVWFSRAMQTEADYIIAGRRLGIGLVTFSVFSTYFGAEAIVATAGSVHEKGLSGALVDPFAYAAAILLVAVFFAARLWRADLVTFADFFRVRYSPGVERLVVLVLLPGSVLWAAAQVRAFGQVLSANSTLSLSTAIGLAALLVGVYSVVGGLLADAVTDLIQGVVVMVGLSILGLAVVHHMGSLSAALALVPQERLSFSFDGSVLRALETIAVPVCGTIVAVELVSRFLGARSAHDAAWGTLIGGVMYVLVGQIPIFLGLVGPVLMPDLKDAEQIVPKLASAYLTPVLHV
ncbi:MAG: sodium:solute symporter, partial [Hyphomicrobiaceae bacterium]|nr:sodium:solute symporter [Hyphomicrobiaceae bacterium]